METITYKPIGLIHTPFRESSGTPIQPVFAGDVEGRVEVLPAYREGLDDLAGFDRIWLLYHCHRSATPSLQVVPYRDDASHGVFATRAPARPNAIGMSCVRLLDVDGSTLHVAEVDMLDGSPLLDIKPYVRRFDAFDTKRHGWLDVANETQSADDRFLKPME